MAIVAKSTPAEKRLGATRGQRRHHFFRAALVGIGAAVTAIAFDAAITGLRRGVVLASEALSNYSFVRAFLVIICAILFGALAAWLTGKLAPEAAGSGIPHVKAVLLHLRDLHPIRVFLAKFVGGTLALASGFSLGREGPTIHLGATVASALGRLMRVPVAGHGHMIACGAGAGLAAAFNAPLAGFIFVIEELRREFSPVTYGSALIAAVVADGVERVYRGSRPSLPIGSHDAPGLGTLPFAIIVGIVAGLLAAGFNRGLLRSVAPTAPIRSYAPWKRAAFIGLIVGVVGVALPLTTLASQKLIEQIFSPEFLAGSSGAFLMVFLLLEVFLTIACYAASVPGGIFAPMLIQGALVGILMGKICGEYLHLTSLSLSIFGLLGMAAYFSAVVRAPLTGVVLISEMTENFGLLFMFLVASLVAYVVSEALRTKPIYEALLQLGLRRGTDEEEADILEEPIVFDLVIEHGSQIDGTLVRELRFPPGCLLITVRRGGISHVPEAGTQLQAGDELSVLISAGSGLRVGVLRELTTA